MFFSILGNISDVETIATGKNLREQRRLRKCYSGLRWRKQKGVATIELADGTFTWLNCTGTKLMELDQKSSRLSGSWAKHEKHGK